MKLRSGLRFNFETVDYIPLILYYRGIFEPKVVEYLKKIVTPGDTVLDVGANVGFHTLEAWNAVGKEGRVISVEASPAHAAAVRINLEANQLPTDDVLNMAVGDHEGEVRLGLPASGNQGMFGVNAGSESSFSCRMHRIDDVLGTQELTELALIKMDIEGSELGALRGAIETISTYRPAILIELNDVALERCGGSSSGVVSFLQDAGYEGWVIKEAGLRAIEPGVAHDCDECLFVPADAQQLRQRLGLGESPSQ